jgi:prepilin-type N-terminal cleavage/methylation domain-containing protein
LVYFIVGESIKKRFTLIELLAVILILGIIALIAIPTVNKIINEAKTETFKNSNNNIMKSIENECQIQLIKGKTPTLSYSFQNGESSSQINVKGELPNEGFITLDDNCSIIDFYLKKQNLVYSNNENVTNDYMLKAPSSSESIFKTRLNYF